MAVLGPMLSITQLACFLFALQPHILQAVAKFVFAQRAGCNPGMIEQIQNSFPDVDSIANAGTVAIRDLARNPSDEDEKERIQMPLETLFGEEIAPPYEPIGSREGHLRLIKGMRVHTQSRIWYIYVLQLRILADEASAVCRLLSGTATFHG